MISWDLTVLKLINLEWTHPLLDWLMPAVSAAGSWLPLLLLLVAIVVWRGRWRAVWMCFCIAATVGVSDGLVSRNIKFLTERVRPRNSVEGLIVRDLAIAKPEFMRLFHPPCETGEQESGEDAWRFLPQQPHDEHVCTGHGDDVVQPTLELVLLCSGCAGGLLAAILRCPLAHGHRAINGDGDTHRLGRATHLVSRRPSLRLCPSCAGSLA
jgi:hypothetical protein